MHARSEIEGQIHAEVANREIPVSDGEHDPVLVAPSTALEQLVDLKFNRILTSGGTRTAVDGLDQLRVFSQSVRPAPGET